MTPDKQAQRKNVYRLVTRQQRRFIKHVKAALAAQRPRNKADRPRN